MAFLNAPLAITPGEPAGIGPDLVICLVQEGITAPIVVIADPDLLERRALALNLPLTIIIWQGQTFSKTDKATLMVLPQRLAQGCMPGELNPANAGYVLHCLDVAIDGCLEGRFSGHVTGPVHKGLINEAGIVFSGHTEYLQERCGVEKVVMMLANRHMRVALATTHIPLLEVAASLNKTELTHIFDILITDLNTKFGIEKPRVLVSGLNPHAGESGHMGREEIEIIEPVMAAMQARHGSRIELIGPLPADTLFTPKYLSEADAVLAMFHDQGLPVLKYAGFGESVNITLGLPMIRTSVDHGTALDLAGSGDIDVGSLRCAIDTAVQMVETTQ